jgi:hypothetical protein
MQLFEDEEENEDDDEEEFDASAVRSCARRHDAAWPRFAAAFRFVNLPMPR